MNAKCPYCTLDDAATMGKYAGYCSTECKTNHLAYLVRIGELPIPPEKSDPKLPTIVAVEQPVYVPNNGTMTCGHMVNGKLVCNRKLNSGHRGVYCGRHQ